jgi:predicted  nucleic acid-binding Zn-ribbon protein
MTDFECLPWDELCLLLTCHIIQEAASQTEASVTRAQQELQQGQQQLQQQQQQNLVAMRAQIQQLDCRCDASSAATNQLQRLLQDLQGQADALGRDAAADHDQLVVMKADAESARTELQEAVQQVEQQMGKQLQQQREELTQCAGAAGGALDKCEQLRQGAVVLAGRLDAVLGQIQAAVQPLQER